MMVTISWRSVFANLVTTPPILLAIPVSKSAPPTINMATNRMTLLFVKPANASFVLSTPVSTRPIHTIIDVTASGIRSHTNITMANKRNNSVTTTGSIKPLLFHWIHF